MVQMTYFQYVNRRVPRLHVQTLQQRFESSQATVDQNINRLLTSLSSFKAVGAYARALGQRGLRFRNLMFHG
ncbi:hypothetical protein, partial [Agathobacter rectalis]